MNDLLTQSDNDLLSAPATDQDMLQLSAALANLDTGICVVFALYTEQNCSSLIENKLILAAYYKICPPFDRFFPSMIFCGEAAKKTSIDGLKWRDLVMGRWWLVNFKVSAVRCHKGFHVLNSARQPSPCKRPRARGQPIPPQSYSISKLQS